MSDLARRLIRENIEKHHRGEDARVLDLGNCGMTEVPEEIGECVWVETLLLGRADVEYLLDEKDASGIYLYFSSNTGELNTIHSLEAIQSLTNLKSLSLRTALRPMLHTISDISPLSKLVNLEYLDISDTRVSDLSPIKFASKIKHLYLANSQVEDLSVISSCQSLEAIEISGTLVNDLRPLKQLSQLRIVHCYRTPIIDLAPLSQLEKLEIIGLGYTKLYDLAPLSSLSNIKFFYIAKTNIGNLAPLAKSLKLIRLDCSDSQVSDLMPLLHIIRSGIPVFWKEDEPFFVPEPQFPAIIVENCPLICPPVEFAMESPQAVRDYFEELGEDGRKLNEVKVVFLGEASAGKTSLVKQLMGEQFDDKESQTHGIRIRKMDFAMSDGDTVAAHLWDFGGQEVMHATHQFFLSQRSVYVLLLNSRNDDQAEKWLKYAESFGGRSPVLVVLNKIDENPSFDVNRKTLREKYPQIREFYKLSCKIKDGIDDFREALRREIENADTRRTPFPAHWLKVKEHFSNMKADYIESEEYQRECEKAGVTRAFSQDVLLKFLHDLGVVINFRNLKNFDTQILNPLWLTNGVYRIINSQRVAETGGLLHEDEFDAVINDPRYREENTSEKPFHYPKNKLQYIVRVMQEFELCFQLDTRTFVVPQLLPVQEPDVPMEGAVLRFVIHFPDFLPDSLFPRLMVKLHTYIEDKEALAETLSDRVTASQPVTKPAHSSHTKLAWRTGMVLHKPNIFKASARVRWDKEDRKILVDACGEERRRFLSFIRETVKEIVATFSSLSYSELVPIPDSTDTEEYEYLVEAEKAGEKEVFVKSLKKRVSIADLLNGVEEPAMRDEVEQLPVKAFVSYAHKDLEYLKEMRSALAPLIRLQKLQLWHDRDINAGDEWREVLFKQLDEADIVICLVSADFVASDFCYQKEFGMALEAHRRGEKTIVPVKLRKTDWQDLPIAELQGVPGEWITSAKNKDEAWTQVSASLRPALDRAKQRKSKMLEERRMGGGR